jgi:hypothetical protein
MRRSHRSYHGLENNEAASVDKNSVQEQRAEKTELSENKIDHESDHIPEKKSCDEDITSSSKRKENDEAASVDRNSVQEQRAEKTELSENTVDHESDQLDHCIPETKSCDEDIPSSRKRKRQMIEEDTENAHLNKRLRDLEDSVISLKNEIQAKKATEKNTIMMTFAAGLIFVAKEFWKMSGTGSSCSSCVDEFSWL